MREEVRSRWWYVAAFLLCGISKCMQGIKVPFIPGYWMDSYPFTHLSVIICAAICIAWTISVRSHIMQSTVRRLLACIGLCMIFGTIIQFSKYKFFNFPEILFLKRFCRYLYYLPATLIPLLLYLCAIKTADPEKKLKEKAVFLLILWSALNLLILTNDYLGLAFVRLTETGEDIAPMNYREAVILSFVWDGVLLARTFFVLYKSTRLKTARKKFWLPVACLLTGLLIFIVNILTPGHIVERLIYIYAVYDAMIIAFCEGCIAIGLIPSNFGYSEIFEASSLSAQIIDGTGKVALKSRHAIELPPEIIRKRDSAPVMLDADTRLQGQPIDGVYVYWTEDVSEMNRMYASLKETAGDLMETRLLVQAENELKEERIRLETQRQLYDHIATAANLQIQQVSDLGERASECTEEQEQIMREAMLPLAYVKRLANLMLLSEQRKEIPFDELRTSMEESLKYLTYQNVSVLLLGTSEKILPADLLILIYQYFQQLLEKALPDLSGVIIHIEENKDSLTLKFMIGTTPERVKMEGWKEKFEGYQVSLSEKVTEEMIIFLLAIPPAAGKTSAAAEGKGTAAGG